MWHHLAQGEALPPQQHDEDMSDMMTYGGFQKWGIPNFWMVYNGKLFIINGKWMVYNGKWMVYNGTSQSKVDDLGVPLF